MKPFDEPTTAPSRPPPTGTSRCSGCASSPATPTATSACSTTPTSPPSPLAIGVVYRPDTELASHYFYASLPHQFDQLVWFDETHAVEPLGATVRPSANLPETYPFGL